MTRKQKIQLLLKDSYLKMIKNSVGSLVFKTRYGKINDVKKDLLKSGNYRICCGFFVSSILLIFKLIKEPHLTVNGVEADLEKSNWKKIIKPKIGSILIWEKGKNGEFGNNPTRHIGFYIGKNKAISTHHKTGKPFIHNYKFGKHNRKIEKILWHDKLNEK